MDTLQLMLRKISNLEVKVQGIINHLKTDSALNVKTTKSIPAVLFNFNDGATITLHKTPLIGYSFVYCAIRTSKNDENKEFYKTPPHFSILMKNYVNEYLQDFIRYIRYLLGEDKFSVLLENISNKQHDYSVPISPEEYDIYTSHSCIMEYFYCNYLRMLFSRDICEDITDVYIGYGSIFVIFEFNEHQKPLDYILGAVRKICMKLRVRSLEDITLKNTCYAMVSIMKATQIIDGKKAYVDKYVSDILSSNNDFPYFNTLITNEIKEFEDIGISIENLKKYTKLQVLDENGIMEEAY